MIIQLLDGTSFDTADYNLKRLFHRIPSPDIQHDIASVDGRSDIITNSKINNRIISVEFLYDVYDIYDFYSLRERLNSLFVRDDSFYIIFKREPYKRWKVRLASQFNLEPNPSMQSFTIEFLTDKPYAESLYTANELIKEWDIGQHAWNGTIDWDNNPPSYTFNSNRFIVKNLGTAPIDPRVDLLEITLTGSFPEFARITNLTTREAYGYERPLSSTDRLMVKGIQTFRNGNSDFVNTNKRLITLAPGDNDILIEGGTASSVSFNFRFLYK